MRRAAFGYVALALALVVVFAPPPSGADGAPREGGAGGKLIGRALAPTIDTVDVREQDTARSVRDSVPLLWMVCLLALSLASPRRRTATPTDPSFRSSPFAASKGRGCRAPPLSLV